MVWYGNEYSAATKLSSQITTEDLGLLTLDRPQLAVSLTSVQ
jgi:hypothetical protein